MEIRARELQNILKRYDKRFSIIGFGNRWLRENGGCCGLRYADEHVGSLPPKIYEYRHPDYCAYDRMIDNGKIVYKKSRPHRTLREVLKMIAQHLPGKDVRNVIKDIRARQ